MSWSWHVPVPRATGLLALPGALPSPARPSGTLCCGVRNIPYPRQYTPPATAELRATGTLTACPSSGGQYNFCSTCASGGSSTSGTCAGPGYAGYAGWSGQSATGTPATFAAKCNAEPNCAGFIWDTWGRVFLLAQGNLDCTTGCTLVADLGLETKPSNYRSYHKGPPQVVERHTGRCTDDSYEYITDQYECSNLCLNMGLSFSLVTLNDETRYAAHTMYVPGCYLQYQYCRFNLGSSATGPCQGPAYSARKCLCKAPVAEHGSLTQV